MKPFYLHVGLPRCASTLIERIFHHPRYDGYQALAAAGIRPLPRLGMEMRRALSKPVWTDSFCSYLRDYHVVPMLSHEASGFFASDEGLTNVHDRANTPMGFEDRARFIPKMLEGFQPHIFLLVRNQARYVVSMYGLSLQNGGTLDFDEYVNAFPLEHLNWLAIADALADAVGAENLTVLPFEKEFYSAANAASADFLEAMQRVMGISEPAKLENQDVINPSLSPKFFGAQLEINRAAKSTTEPKDTSIFADPQNYLKPAGYTPMSDRQKNRILSFCSDSNRRLFDTYMPAFDKSLYQPGGM